MAKKTKTVAQATEVDVVECDACDQTFDPEDTRELDLGTYLYDSEPNYNALGYQEVRSKHTFDICVFCLEGTFDYKVGGVPTWEQARERAEQVIQDHPMLVSYAALVAFAVFLTAVMTV